MVLKEACPDWHLATDWLEVLNLKNELLWWWKLRFSGLVDDHLYKRLCSLSMESLLRLDFLLRKDLVLVLLMNDAFLVLVGVMLDDRLIWLHWAPL